MNDLKFAFRQLLKHPGFTAVAALALVSGMAGRVFADLAVRHVEVAPRAAKSQVPEVTAQGRFLAPQAISAVDVSADEKFITVGTMAFSHDANVWQFGPDGTAISQRHFPPWAPMQVATLPGGRALAVGLAYLWWKHPEGTRGLFYTAFTGITITLSILCKLLSVSVLVPIALLMVARFWQIWHKQPGKRLTGLFPIFVGIAAFIGTFVILLLPFSGSYQAILQSVITFHNDAAQVYSRIQQANTSTIQDALTSLLSLTAFFGIMAALLRRDWRVIPLIVWLIVTLYLLWHQVPLFQHHLVSLTPPLIALAVMGIGNQSAHSCEDDLFNRNQRHR